MVTQLYELLDSNFGVKTSYNLNPVVAQVQVTVTKIVNVNPNRLGLLIVNAGAFPIDIAPVNTVAVGAGITLTANGGGISFIWDEDFEFLAGEFFAIANGGVSNISVTEVISV